MKSEKTISKKTKIKNIQNKTALSDPNLQQEQEKYENPVPSRDFILTIIREYNAPMSRKTLLETLKIKDDERQEGVRRRLRAMERDGQLIFTKGKRYALPEKLDLIKGTVIGHRDGFGFLNVEGQKEDWFIPNSQMRLVLHGDYVLAQPSGTDKRGRREVRIVRVLKNSTKQVVGRFFLEEGIGYVVPDDSRLSRDILIPQAERSGARMGQVVVVELKPRSATFSQPVGSIVEVLGEKMDKGMETEIAIRNHDIPHVFPEEVKQQAAKFTETVPEEAKVGRVNLRDLPLVTIDGEDARDFDDAVYCQPEPNGGWRLWVAIADVSYYVRLHTALDKEAHNRGNSVYFPNRVVPMLPEILSNGLCSLNPQVDRLCMVCEMTISKNGVLDGYRFYEAVMNSHARLTYNKVAKILDGDEELQERYRNLVPHIQDLHNMFQALLKSRAKRGAIDFETIESKFIFNAMGRIDRIEAVQRNDAHKIIEECMILANIAAAKFMESHNEPALYRIHDKPSEEKCKAFREFLGECGLTLGGGETPSTSDYAKLLAKIKDRPDHELIQTMLLRSLRQAVYSPDNVGHFGLALTEYAHFTSPIRRYPDLSLHRGIKYLLAKEKGSKHKNTATGGHHYPLDQMHALGDHCSMTERRADDATRDVADWLKCEYMQDHVGEEFTGVIASVTGFGLFVRLDDLFIDGLVHISTLANEYYRFDGEQQRLIGENTGTVYRLGDKVKIKVVGVHLETKQIDFAFLDSERKPRRLGKTARDNARKGFSTKDGDKPVKAKAGQKHKKRRKPKNKKPASKPARKPKTSK